MSTSWDAHTYDRSSEPQRSWAEEVIARLDVAPDATVLDIDAHVASDSRTEPQAAASWPQRRSQASDHARLLGFSQISELGLKHELVTNPYSGLVVREIAFCKPVARSRATLGNKQSAAGINDV
ncbi:MAG TPA: hypothetical protein VFV03_05520 [Solirubrobacteraceae bacterium]|nr:hypothetical protein [Solirubrobacteraceae bacterium]